MDRTTNNMNIETPKGWRKGQTIFNFLWWLKEHKGYKTEIAIPILPTREGYDPKGYSEGRMADPFHIQDAEIDKLYKEFLEQHGTN